MQFDDFLKIIDLLKNPDSYQAQVAELTARNQAIQDSITQLNIGSDIAQATAAAHALNDQAQVMIVQATAQAADIIAGAQKAFDSKYAEIAIREVAADQALANYNGIKAQWAARDSELRVAEKALVAGQAQLLQDQSDLRVKQAEVDDRLTKLRQVMG